MAPDPTAFRAVQDDCGFRHEIQPPLFSDAVDAMGRWRTTGHENVGKHFHGSAQRCPRAMVQCGCLSGPRNADRTSMVV